MWRPLRHKLKSFFLIKIGWGVVLCASACAHSPKPSDLNNVTEKKPKIMLVTKLPTHFELNSKNYQDLLQKERLLPKKILRLAQIRRPTAEMRAGPGGHFPLKQQLLKKGDNVLLLRRISVWQQVLCLNTQEKGWVHYQTIATMKDGDGHLVMKLTEFPAVFAMRPIHQAFDGQTGRPLDADIPKGAVFPGIKWTKNKVLVVIPQTNSVMWLARTMAQ